MKLNKILNANNKPQLFKKGTAEMWTDPYISKQLLEVHFQKSDQLCPFLPLRSRKDS